VIKAAPKQKTKMIQCNYKVNFNTPAFLGNAEQAGLWRTPPFKHLLREWWRVAWAEKHDPAGVSVMRAEEARLFGSAADGSGNRSLVRIRLGRWDMGEEKSWGNDLPVIHSEVQRNQGEVGSQFYLGYGRLKCAGGNRLKANAAIQSDEKADFRIAFPDNDSTLLDRATGLMSAFGAIGGRSRNGWGSFELVEEKTAIAPNSLPLRDWQSCLALEWAHAIGQDEKGALVWRTGEFFDWRELMQEMAKIKIALRTRFRFHSGRNASRPEDRHWLSYPVTNHSVRDWRNARLPNSLRFKVRKDENGKYYGVIFHMPCKPPSDFRPDRATLIKVWSSVHKFLDAEGGLQRGR